MLKKIAKRCLQTQMTVLTRIITIIVMSKSSKAASLRFKAKYTMMHLCKGKRQTKKGGNSFTFSIAVRLSKEKLFLIRLCISLRSEHSSMYTH